MSFKDNRELCSHVYTEVKKPICCLVSYSKGPVSIQPTFYLIGCWLHCSFAQHTSKNAEKQFFNHTVNIGHILTIAGIINYSL